MILILGMPRSGTSFICEILENLGYNFNIDDQNKLDQIYLPNGIWYFKTKVSEPGFFLPLSAFEIWKIPTPNLALFLNL